MVRLACSVMLLASLFRGETMVYYIDYLHWVVVCSFFVWFIFLANIKKKAIIVCLLCLNFALMYFPRLRPVKDLKVISYELTDLVESDGKIMDNMISFTDGNYYINDNLKDKLEPGIYQTVKVIQTNELLKFGDIEIYVHINSDLKDIWVQDVK